MVLRSHFEEVSDERAGLLQSSPTPPCRGNGLDDANVLKRENAALRERLSRLSQESLSINESLELDAVPQEVLDAARSLTGARYGVITLLDDAGQIQDFLSSGMTEEASLLWETPNRMRIFEHLSGLSGPLRIPNLFGLLKQLGFPEFRPPVPVDGTVSFLAAPGRARRQHIRRRPDGRAGV